MDVQQYKLYGRGKSVASYPVLYARLVLVDFRELILLTSGRIRDHINKGVRYLLMSRRTHRCCFADR